MTEPSPGPGWWLASDGNWYPPHLHPDARPAATSGRRVETDEELLAAFRVDDPRPDAAPRTSPIDEIRATTGGGIDWEAVARERAAAREARAKQASGARRKWIAAGAAVVALAVIVLATRGGGGDDDRTVTTPGTSTTAPVTTAGATSTVAPITTASGATGTGASGGPTSTAAPASTASPSTTAKPATTAAPGTSVSVFSLQPGSCIDQDNLTTGLVTTVKTVPCDQPHSHEVYYRTSVTPADAAYDAAKVTAFANQACTDGFKTYVGIAYEQSKYYFVHLAPSAESWNKNRDRDVVCLLLLEGQKLTSSVKGKGE